MNKKTIIAISLIAFLYGCETKGQERSPLVIDEIITLSAQQGSGNEEQGQISTANFNDQTRGIKVSQDYYALAESINNYLISKSYNGTALVSIGDEVILSKGYGFSNIEDNEPMSVDKKFQIASVSKSFVAVSILQLMEQGKLALNDTVGKYLTDIPNGSSFTIHNLLTHTSGLVADESLSNYSNKIEVEDLVARAFQPSNLRFEVGSTTSYSNLGYDLLGLIVEKASGLLYEDYLKKNIFEPLGMKDSGLNLDGKALGNMATAYNGGIEEGYNAKIFHPSFGYSSGGIHSTATDLHKYERALANNTLISKESYDLMAQTQTNIGSKEYGYGWYTNTWIDNIVSHPGNLVGWHSMLLRHNDDKVSVILLTNHDNSDMNMAYTIAQSVLANTERE